MNHASTELTSDLECPHCGKRQSSVLDSRGTVNRGIRRRRQCHFCLKRFTTYEVAEGTIRKTWTAQDIRNLFRQASTYLSATVSKKHHI